MRQVTPRLDSGQASAYLYCMTNPTLGDLIRSWKQQKALVEEHEAAAKSARALLDDMETDINAKMHELGIESAAEDGVSISIKTKWRARYDPDLWADIMKWAATNGVSYILQRRLNDAKIMELVDNGIALPEGLSVESYQDLAFRRS